MKKVTTFLMSALAMVIALTAWANAEKIGAPRGVTTPPTVVSVEPNAPVDKLEKVVFVFDQPIKYYGQIPVGVFDVNVWNAMGFDTMCGANGQVDPADDTRLVFTFTSPVTTKGKYVLDIYPDNIESKNGNGFCNEVLSIYEFEVAGSGGGDTPVVPGGKLNFTMLTSTSTEYEDNLPNIAVKFDNYNVTFDATKSATLSQGAVSHNLTINTMFFDMKDEPLIMFNSQDLQLAEGQWTLTIPAGLFKGTDGSENEAASYVFTLKKKAQVVIPDTPLEVTSILYYQYDDFAVQNSYKDPIEIKAGAVLPSLFVNDKIEICTNVNEYLGVLWLDVYQGEIVKDDEGYDANPPIRSFYTYNKNAMGNFVIEVSGSNVKLAKDTEYTFSIYAADTENVAPSDRHYFGSDVNPVQIKVKGDAEPFKYSAVKFVSIDPSLDKEIVDENQEFVVTFSGPVTIDDSMDEMYNPSSGVNLGMGMVGSFEKLEKMNAEGSVWKFKPSASYLKSSTATADFLLKVVDAQGLFVKFDDQEGSEEATRLTFQYDCHLACPAVTVTPAAGTYEKIFSFEAVAENGSDINMGSGLDKPYLTTTGGYRVAEADMESVKRYDASGKDIDAGATGGSDVSAKKITFNLNKEVTAPGKYILHCPFAAFSLGSQYSGASSRTMTIEYTIEGTPSISGTTIPAGSEISELTLAGFYADSPVELVIPEVEPGETPRVPKIQLRDEESSLGNYDMIIANSGGRSIIMADFNENGKPYKLEPGVNYTMRIAEGALAIEGTDMLYPEMSLSFKGAAEAAVVAPEFVKLTHAVADHVSSVSEVAKGKSVKIALTPAEGWKVEKVTLDNKDVTADVKNNEYTTPELAADARVDVTLAFDGVVFTPASADEVFSDFNLRAWSEGGQIYVAGLEVGMKLDVFTVAGALAGSYVADDTVVACKVASGVYVVVVTDKAGKSQALKIQNK